MFEIPPFRIDSRILPPPLHTSLVDSFAYNTLRVRIPRILRETIEINSFGSDIERALEGLYGEIVSGRIRELNEPTPDRNFWNTVSRDYIGRTWLDVPWYWAESFFYRRLLEATRYFENDIDPYSPKKAVEWGANAAPASADLILRDAPREMRERFRYMLYASLWANRSDLSYSVGTRFGNMGSAAEDLLVDDSERVWEFFSANRPARVAMIADNTGLELVLDLALIDLLLTENLAQRIDYHLKPQPFFVSDTMMRDIELGLRAMEQGEPGIRALATRIRTFLAEARLVLSTHWFYATCLFYFQLPDDLFAEIRTADFVILKGDANYRRLLGDARWGPTASFVKATEYFPAPLVSLRTLKAEIVVGLRQSQVEELEAVDSQWRVNGKRGLVQANWTAGKILTCNSGDLVGIQA